MKKLADILFAVGAIFVLAGAFFKIMHYPGNISATCLLIGYCLGLLAFILRIINYMKNAKKPEGFDT